MNKTGTAVVKLFSESRSVKLNAKKTKQQKQLEKKQRHASRKLAREESKGRWSLNRDKAKHLQRRRAKQATILRNLERDRKHQRFDATLGYPGEGPVRVHMDRSSLPATGSMTVTDFVEQSYSDSESVSSTTPFLPLGRIVRRRGEPTPNGKEVAPLGLPEVDRKVPRKRRARKPSQQRKLCHWCASPQHLKAVCPRRAAGQPRTEEATRNHQDHVNRQANPGKVKACRSVSGAMAEGLREYEAQLQGNADATLQRAEETLERVAQDKKEKEDPEAVWIRAREAHAAVVDRMYSIVSNAFMTKDHESIDDRAVVTRSMADVARNGKLIEVTRKLREARDNLIESGGCPYNPYPDELAARMSSLTADEQRDKIYEEGFKKSMECKIRRLKMEKTSTTVPEWRDVLMTMWNLDKPTMPSDARHWPTRTIEKLQGLRAMSQIPYDKAKLAAAYMLIFIHIFVVVWAEEYAKSWLNLSIQAEIGPMLKMASDNSQWLSLVYLCLATAGPVIVTGGFFATLETKKTGKQGKALWFLCGHILFMLLGTVGFFLHLAWNLSCWWRRRIDDSFNVTVQDVCYENREMKKVSVQDGFKRTEPEPKCTPRFAARMLYGIKGFFVEVARGCCHNEVISIDARVGKKLPVHESEATQIAVEVEWDKLNKESGEWVRGLIRPVRIPVSFRKWVRRFPPRKRNMFIAMYREGKGYNALRADKNTASAFIKREKTMTHVVDPVASVAKDPRWIQGCPVELTYDIGRFTSRYQKHIKTGLAPTNTEYPEDSTTCSLDAIRAGKHCYYTSGSSGNEIGETLGHIIETVKSATSPEDQIVVLEDDQSRFDVHLRKGAFKYLQAGYRKHLPRRVARRLRRKRSRGRSKLGIKYSVDFTMQSGWPDTSLGDTLVNAAMKTHIHGRGRLWVSIICGDDSITVTTATEMERLGGRDGIVEAYKALGMEVKAFTTTDILMAEFCSGRFIPYHNSYVLVPKLGRMLARLGWDMKNRNKRNQVAWARSIAETLKVFGCYDPILAALGRSIARLTGEGKVIRDEVNPYKKHVQVRKPISRSDYLTYVDRHYGLSANDVDKLVAHMEQLTHLGAFDHPLLVEVAERDR